MHQVRPRRSLRRRRRRRRCPVEITEISLKATSRFELTGNTLHNNIIVIEYAGPGTNRDICVLRVSFTPKVLVSSRKSHVKRFSYEPQS